MAKFEITSLDLSSAEDYLVSVIQEKFPDLDVGKGSVLRDVLIAPFAVLYATLRGQMEALRARQSLLSLSALEADEDVDALVDQILSNWLLSRGSGNYARGKITVYLADEVDVLIPKTAQFVRLPGIVFYPDTEDEVVFIPRTELRKTVDANGRVLGYSFELPAKSAEPGEKYNVARGNFTSWTQFSPAVVRVSNLMAFSGGKDIETTAELINRAKTAISIRDLNSMRAIDSVLRDEFSSIQAVVVKGFGDAALLRDYYEPLRLHLGGYADVFVKTPLLTDQRFDTIVGAAVDDPRPGYYVFKDDTISDFTTKISPSIAKECLLRVYNPASGEASLYKIDEVVPEGVRVSREHMFPRALPSVLQTLTIDIITSNTFTPKNYVLSSSDVDCYVQIRKSAAGNVGVHKITAVDVNTNRATVDTTLSLESDVTAYLCDRVLEYTIGNDHPTYANRVSGVGGAALRTGMFTKEFGTSGRILLPFVPVYYIKEVVLPGTAYPAWQESDQKIHFNKRVNTTPLAKGEFRVVCLNPTEGNSGWQLCEIILAVPSGQPSTFWDAQSATVFYDTLQDFSNVWDYVTDDFRRVICANIIPRGMFAAYVSFTLSYKLKPKGSAFDEATAIQKLVEFINTFPEDERLDVSDIVYFMRSNYADIDYIAPLRLVYNLYAPDGRVIPYASTGKVSIDVSHQTGVVATDKLQDPLSVGVADDIVFYVTRPDMITLVRL